MIASSYYSTPYHYIFSLWTPFSDAFPHSHHKQNWNVHCLSIFEGQYKLRHKLPMPEGRVRGDVDCWMFTPWNFHRWTARCKWHLHDKRFVINVLQSIPPTGECPIPLAPHCFVRPVISCTAVRDSHLLSWLSFILTWSYCSKVYLSYLRNRLKLRKDRHREEEDFNHHRQV